MNYWLDQYEQNIEDAKQMLSSATPQKIEIVFKNSAGDNVKVLIDKLIPKCEERSVDVIDADTILAMDC